MRCRSYFTNFSRIQTCTTRTVIASVIQFIRICCRRWRCRWIYNINNKSDIFCCILFFFFSLFYLRSFSLFFKNALCIFKSVLIIVYTGIPCSGILFHRRCGNIFHIFAGLFQHIQCLFRLFLSIVYFCKSQSRICGFFINLQSIIKCNFCFVVFSCIQIFGAQVQIFL